MSNQWQDRKKRPAKPEQAFYKFLKPKFKQAIDSMSMKTVHKLIDAGEFELLFEVIGIMCNQKRIHNIENASAISDPNLAPIWSEEQEKAIELVKRLVNG